MHFGGAETTRYVSLRPPPPPLISPPRWKTTFLLARGFVAIFLGV